MTGSSAKLEKTNKLSYNENKTEHKPTKSKQQIPITSHKENGILCTHLQPPGLWSGITGFNEGTGNTLQTG